MKKNMIALAVAAAFAAPVAMADAPVVYGKLNLNINATEGKDASVNSTASRLGIKGSEDLGNGLKTVYKVEFALNDVADTSGKPALTARNQYLGLAGGFGTVLMGRHDTPLKMSQPSDLFNDGAADLSKLTNGVTSGEDRKTDVLAYVSPTFSGVKLIAATVMDAAKGSSDAASVALTYGSTKKGLYLAAANTSNTDYSVTRLSAQYKTGGLIVNAMNNTADGSDTTEGNFTHIQAAYKMGKFMPKVKYAITDKKGADAENAYSVGLNYSLGKKTTAYVYTVVGDKVTSDATILGMVHKF
jgi:predicted porin